MSRKALVVGINYYQNSPNLYGCVRDAKAVKAVLDRHDDYDAKKNFAVEIELGTSDSSMISRKKLKTKIIELFSEGTDIALFYFSGHGYTESTGGYLITSECSDGDSGMPMNELLQIVNESPVKNKIIILDCCHSGIVGAFSPSEDNSVLSEGLTILTASSKNQYAMEENGSGVFTSLLIDALNGSAANILGEITPGSVYAHIDQSLGAWEQRPIFKTNVRNFIPLRRVQPAITLPDLKMLTILFTEKEKAFPLTPEFEPSSPSADRKKVELFKILQKYNRLNLVKPIDEEHMYYAAMNSKFCKLTLLGKHYWRLIKKEKI